MAEPWQVREYEQSQFIGRLADKVRNVADLSENYTLFICKFCIALMESISATAGGKPLCYSGKAEDNLRDELIDEIRDFQRVESEMVILLGLLLEKLSITVHSFTQRAYQRDGMNEPEKVYGARR